MCERPGYERVLRVGCIVKGVCVGFKYRRVSLYAKEKELIESGS